MRYRVSSVLNPFNSGCFSVTPMRPVLESNGLPPREPLLSPFRAASSYVPPPGPIFPPIEADTVSSSRSVRIVSSAPSAVPADCPSVSECSRPTLTDNVGSYAP